MFGSFQPDQNYSDLGARRRGPPPPISAPSATGPNKSWVFGQPPQAPIVESFDKPPANLTTGRFSGATGQTGGLATGSNPGASSNKPEGGLFGSKAGGSLFGNQSTNAPSQTQSQTTSGGFSGLGLGQPTNTAQNQTGSNAFGGFGSSFSGLGNNTSQIQAGPSLFNANQPKPANSLFGNTQPAGGNLGLGSTLSFGQSVGGSSASTGAKIDVDHLRPTTKYDQLTDQLQNAISEIDDFILQQIKMSNEVADLLPAIAESGGTIENDVKFVEQKMEELEVGLENDAEDIETIRKGTVEKDAVEAKVAFRQVDRLKMPTQYQTIQNGSFGSSGASGLGGWWNHPQTFERNLRGKPGQGAGRGIQLPGDDDPDAGTGPANLVDFFDRRAGEMSSTLDGYKAVFREIEEHLAGAEVTLDMKLKDLEYGRGDIAGVGNSKEEKIRNLTFALGVFEKSIYDEAVKVGEVRNEMQDLELRRLENTASFIGRS